LLRDLINKYGPKSAIVDDANAKLIARLNEFEKQLAAVGARKPPPPPKFNPKAAPDSLWKENEEIQPSKKQKQNLRRRERAKAKKALAKVGGPSAAGKEGENVKPPSPVKPPGDGGVIKGGKKPMKRAYANN